MSIDWLWDLERAVETGKSYYACQAAGRNQWAIARSADELRKVAKRAASHKKLAVDIVRLVSPHEMAGALYLVLTEIGEPEPRGESNIKLACVETKEAAEIMCDDTPGAVADLRHAGRRYHRPGQMRSRTATEAHERRSGRASRRAMSATGDCPANALRCHGNRLFRRLDGVPSWDCLAAAIRPPHIGAQGSANQEQGPRRDWPLSLAPGPFIPRP